MRRLRTLYDEADAPCRYQRVAAALEEAIREGLFKPGDALPTQRALAAELESHHGHRHPRLCRSGTPGTCGRRDGAGNVCEFHRLGCGRHAASGAAAAVHAVAGRRVRRAVRRRFQRRAALESRLHCAVRVAESFAAQGARQPSAPPERQRACGASELPSPGGHGSTPRGRRALGAALRRASLGPRSFGVRRLPARAHDHTRHPVHARRQDSRGKPELSAAARTLLAAASAACARAHRRMRHAAGRAGERLPLRRREGRVSHAVLPQSHAHAHARIPPQGHCGSLPQARRVHH